MLSTWVWLPCVPAGVASSATIAEGSGSTSGAVLKVLRPTSVSDDTVASYMIQAYTDAAGSTKVRHGVTGQLRLRAADACIGQGGGKGVAVLAQAGASGCLLSSLPAVWRGGARQQHCRGSGWQDTGHCLCLPLPRLHRC